MKTTVFPFPGAAEIWRTEPWAGESEATRSESGPAELFLNVGRTGAPATEGRVSRIPGRPPRPMAGGTLASKIGFSGFVFVRSFQTVVWGWYPKATLVK